MKFAFYISLIIICTSSVLTLHAQESDSSAIEGQFFDENTEIEEPSDSSDEDNASQLTGETEALDGGFLDKDASFDDDVELDFNENRKKRKKEKNGKPKDDGIYYYQGLSDIYRSPVRRILNMFSLNISTGIGLTRYNQNLQGFTLVQQGNTLFINGNGATPVNDIHEGYSNWFNQPNFTMASPNQNQFDVPAPYLESPINNPFIGTQTEVFDGGNSGLKFRSVSPGVPILGSLHFNYRDFRLGFGLSYELQRISKFQPNVQETEIQAYEPNVSTVIYNKKFLLLGYKFYDYWDYSFAGELSFGTIKAPKKKFDQGLIDRSLFWNIGLSMEKNFSEYFRLIVKPNIEFKNYKLNLPNATGQLRTGYPTFMVNVGISYNFPEIPRSPIPGDHIQLKHVITDIKTGRRAEVRGQRFWKEQNPKVGQNHRQLIRYKGKNKRKLNPY